MNQPPLLQPPTIQVEFFVAGIPKPGGSKKFVGTIKHGPRAGRAILVDASGEKGVAWRENVKAVAVLNWRRPPVQFEPIELSVDFVMPRPKSHYRSNGALKPTAPYWHTNKPDRTKLLRSLEDSLTAIVWADDTQVVTGLVRKFYGDTPGARVRVRVGPERGVAFVEHDAELDGLKRGGVD